MEPNYRGYNGQGLAPPTPEGAATARPEEKRGAEPYPERAWPPTTPEVKLDYPSAGMPLPTTDGDGIPSYQAPSASGGSAGVVAPASTTPVMSPALADDADLIEKEWVEAVKQIVMRTQGDPHSQSRAMNVLRADYMKKRYNKDIKVPED